MGVVALYCCGEKKDKFSFTETGKNDGSPSVTRDMLVEDMLLQAPRQFDEGFVDLENQMASRLGGNGALQDPYLSHDEELLMQGVGAKKAKR